MFTTIFVTPLFNLLAFLVNIAPFGSVAIAIVVMTLLVKFALAPLYRKSIIGQFRMKELEPKIRELKQKYPDKKEQAAKTFELYKEYKISPLSGCLPILIQLPIIFALYRVFLAGFQFDVYHLYSFVKIPEAFSLNFFGMDLAGKSIVMAILAGASQFAQAHFSAKRMKINSDPNDTSMQANMSNMMGKQMQYILPVFVGIISYQISAAIGLYWTVNNIFTTTQELLIYRKLLKEKK
jgi:YidC/Oxa1 family membrane protein insertase